MPDFTWVPANRGHGRRTSRRSSPRAAPHKCRCQALKVPGWIWRDTTQEQRDAALVEQTACGTAGPTSGLIGYVDGEAAGWVAVEPRENYPRLWARKQPWMRMDPELEGVWSVTCFVVRKGLAPGGPDLRARRAPPSTYGAQVGRARPGGLPDRAAARARP